MMVAEIVSVDDATPNFTLERTASSHSLAAAAQRGSSADHLRAP